MRRRSTLQITLMLVGMVALSGCAEDEKRHVYRTKQDCMEDWGSEKGCEEAPAGSGHYGYWYGPRWIGSGYGARGVRSIGAVTVSRGGFGRLGAFHGGFGG